FTPSGSGYAVTKRLRSLVVFGEHDLSQRAPFPQIDLVLCRNVLIYFTRELQQRALQLFAFALHDGGILVLGRTESVSPLAECFMPLQSEQHVYRRYGPRLPVPPVRFIGGAPLTIPRTEQRQRRVAARDLFYTQQELKHARSANENLLLHLPVGVVVVDTHYDIQEINVTARRLLSIRSSAIGEDVVHLAQHVPHRALRTAIDQAIRTGAITQIEAVTVTDPISDAQTVITLVCYPHPPGQDGVPAPQALLLVSDVTSLIGDRQALTEAMAQQQTLAAQLAQANAELQRTNVTLAHRTDELQQALAAVERARLIAEARAARHAQQIEQLAALNHELVTANEDLSQTNTDLRALSETYTLRSEETQAAIEEVETLNEEMQASNEELETMNEELQAAVEELNTSNADLAARSDELTVLAKTLDTAQQHSIREATQLTAILTGIADAVLVVDAAEKPRLTNATYTQWFGEVPCLTDEEGRPLAPEQTPEALAAHGAAFTTTFTQTMDGGERRWYEAVGQPVHGDGAQIWGVVVIRDITERSLRRMQEQFIGLVSHELRTPL
ncbi:MAG: CheR family methyltransferase, partial [Chloroflexales bacterium]